MSVRTAYLALQNDTVHNVEDEWKSKRSFSLNRATAQNNDTRDCDAASISPLIHSLTTDDKFHGRSETYVAIGTSKLERLWRRILPSKNCRLSGRRGGGGRPTDKLINFSADTVRVEAVAGGRVRRGSVKGYRLARSAREKQIGRAVLINYDV